jgi:hypothetical protein
MTCTGRPALGKGATAVHAHRLLDGANQTAISSLLSITSGQCLRGCRGCARAPRALGDLAVLQADEAGVRQQAAAQLGERDRRRLRPVAGKPPRQEIHPAPGTEAGKARASDSRRIGAQATSLRKSSRRAERRAARRQLKIAISRARRSRSSTSMPTRRYTRKARTAAQTPIAGHEAAAGDFSRSRNTPRA